jgi:hypothetical protein
VIETISSEADIANLYKTSAFGPYTKVEDGYGYRGVLIQHRKSGKIQCHICGKWFNSLGKHSGMKHKTLARDYRIKFGFPLSQPLCSVAVSRKNSVNTRRIKPWLKTSAKRIVAWNRANRLKRKHYPESEAFLNSRAICDDQLVRRVLAIADVVGRNPSISDLVKHDCKLYPVIHYRYGTWNNFKKKHNLGDIREKAPTYKKDGVLLALRRWVEEHKRIPKPKDFANTSPRTITVYKHFGSWGRALAVAGISTESRCVVCGNPIRGRFDKKYCSAKCGGRGSGRRFNPETRKWQKTLPSKEV